MRLKLLIVCVLMFSFGNTTLWSQYDISLKCQEGQTLYYRILPDGKSLSVTHPVKEWPYYSDAKPVGVVTVPGVVRWKGQVYEVVEIGEYAFYGCDSLTEVYPGFIKKVGTQAFCGCKKLKHIEFSDHLHSVGEGAFAYCESMERLVLPDSVEQVGISAFSMCTGLKEVVMHLHVEDVCDMTVFHGCSLMEEPKNRKIDVTGHVIWRMNEYEE